MFDTDTINYIDLHLLQGQVDLILSALELYAYNFHNTWSVDINSDREELRNALLFHTFQQILSKYTDCKINEDILSDLQLYNRRKKLRVIKNKKNIA